MTPGRMGEGTAGQSLGASGPKLFPSLTSPYCPLVSSSQQREEWPPPGWLWCE